MKKEYFQVRFGFKVVSRLIEEEKVLQDDIGLYVEYYSENIFDTVADVKAKFVSSGIV